MLTGRRVVTMCCLLNGQVSKLLIYGLSQVERERLGGSLCADPVNALGLFAMESVPPGHAFSVKGSGFLWDILCRTQKVPRGVG